MTDIRHIADPNESISRDAFKKIMGSCPSGVSVVTCGSDDGSHVGMTVSSLSSVSMDPPLLLICINKDKYTLQKIKENKKFAVNIIDRNNADIAYKFSRKMESKFSDTPYTLSDLGNPIIDGVTAYADCRLFSVFNAGDHDIVVGSISCGSVNNDDPLIYFRGHMHADISLAGKQFPGGEA